MAIYWVDPYIEASIGGIHGTSDTVSKTGTYSAPWSLGDIITTSFTTANYPGGLTLTNGDEIRLKGLPRASFLINAGSTWYYNNYYRPATTNPTVNPMNDYITGTTPGWTNTGFVWTFDPTFTDQFAIADSSGDKPLHFFSGQYTQNSTVINTYSNCGINGMMNGPFRDSYPNSGSANGTLFLIDPQYYIDFQTKMPSGQTFYFGCQNGIQIKVTDGWTSETVRNGHTILPFYSNFGNYQPTIQFNTTGNNTTADTWYDIPNTYFIAFTYNTTVARFYYYLNSAMGNHAGNTITQKIGGFVKTDYGYPTYIYNAFYYDNTPYDDTSCNNAEVNYAYGYYPVYLYSRYGNNIETRINNSYGYYASNFNVYGTTGSRTVKFGNNMTYNGPTATFSGTTSAATSVTYENLPGTILYTYTGGGGIFQYNTGYTFTINTPFHNYTSSEFLDNAVITTSTGPTFLGQITDNNDGYINNVKASPAVWYDSFGIFHDGRTSTPHSSFQENMVLGVLDFEGADYKTVSPSFQIRTDKYLYSYTGQYNADTNIHFSSNDYDGIPIGACLSYTRNNTFHYPVLYYNDSSKGDALCFQANGAGGLNDYYKKNIEVPIPAYTTENLRFRADFETSANWDKNFRIDLQYVDVTGARATLQLVNVSSNISRVVYETTIPNANLPATLKPRHMNAVIAFQNSDDPSKKVWVHDIAINLET